MPPVPLHMLAGHPVLARPEVLAGLHLAGILLARLQVARLQVARLQVVALLHMLANAGAFAHPDGTGAEHAAQLASARQVDPVA